MKFSIIVLKCKKNLIKYSLSKATKQWQKFERDIIYEKQLPKPPENLNPFDI